MKTLCRSILKSIFISLFSLFALWVILGGINSLRSRESENPTVVGEHITNIEYGFDAVDADVAVPAEVDGETVMVQDHVVLKGLNAGTTYMLTSDLYEVGGQQISVREALVQNDSDPEESPWMKLAAWYIWSAFIGVILYFVIIIWKNEMG